MARVNVLDLTVKQVASIEEATGLPVDQWGTGPKATIFPAILAAAEGKKPSDYDDMTLSELIDAVTFEDSPGEG